LKKKKWQRGSRGGKGKKTPIPRAREKKAAAMSSAKNKRGKKREGRGSAEGKEGVIAQTENPGREENEETKFRKTRGRRTQHRNVHGEKRLRN